MKHALLLDPGIALPERGNASSWALFFDWVSDGRVRLGRRLWLTLAEVYGSNQLEPPRGLGQLVHKAVGDVLSRGPLEHSVVDSVAELSPTYVGAEFHRQILVDDIVGACDLGVVALATTPAFWPDGTTDVTCTPAPPTNFPLHFQPNLPTAEQAREGYADWFAGRRILIVGGQVDEPIIEALNSSLGIQSSSVTWLASERHKKATNLKAVIDGMIKADFVICVVGKVGHDVSGQMKIHCDRNSFTLHTVRFASHIRGYLEGLAP